MSEPEPWEPGSRNPEPDDSHGGWPPDSNPSSRDYEPPEFESGYLKDAAADLKLARRGTTDQGETIPDDQRVKLVADAALSIQAWLEDHDAEDLPEEDLLGQGEVEP